METSQTPPAALQQEEEQKLSHQFEELLSLLPREDKSNRPIYQYQGFWYPEKYLLAMIECRRHFQSRDTDILLATSPKSGTTWLKALTFAIVNRTLYPDRQHHPFLTNSPHKLIPFLELDLYLDNQIPDLSSLGSPALIATHMPYMALPESIKDSNCKVIYLCRNPRDVVVSFWHFLSKVIAPVSLEDFFELFCAGVSEFGPFWDQVLGYWKASLDQPHKVLFLKYEDLKREPMVVLERMAEFLGYPFTPKEYEEGVPQDILKLCSFDNLSNLEVNKTGKRFIGNTNKIVVDNNAYFRRGEVGDSRNHLTSEMIERLDQITEQKLQGYGRCLKVLLRVISFCFSCLSICAH